MVSHAAPIIGLVRELVGDRQLPLRPGCCSLSKLKGREGIDDVLGAWEAELLADGSHMAGGSTRDWGFEDIVIADGKVRYLLCFISWTVALTVMALKVVNDNGQPDSQDEQDFPVGLQPREYEVVARM